MTIATKAPGQTPFVEFDWAARLAVGETISSAAWSAIPSGDLTTGSDARSGTKTSTKLTGGKFGRLYVVRCTITKNNGLTDVLDTEVYGLASEAV